MHIMAGHSRANSVLNGELKKQSPDSALNSLPPAYLQCVPCGRRKKYPPVFRLEHRGIFIFWDMEARQGSIPYNFVPGVSGKIRHAWRMQPPGNRSIFAWRLYHAAHPCKSAMVTPQAVAIFSRVDTLETALPDSAC